MTKQVTITLSDGTPHTGTLDPDGFLLLPRGKKPAEPWWSRCEADCRGLRESPDDQASLVSPCRGWHWYPDAWFRIRPLSKHTWESIMQECVCEPEVANTHARGNTNYELLGKDASGTWRRYGLDTPLSGCLDTRTGRERVKEPVLGQPSETIDQATRAPQQRDYTNWQEGLGDSAKPEDYDQQPGKYEVEYLAEGGVWKVAPKPCWHEDDNYRVRLRQPQPEQQAQPQGESESDFMRRMLCLAILRVDLNVTPGGPNGGAFVVRGAVALSTAETLRLARLIAEAKA